MKKFFTAVILAVLILNVQIVSAAASVDWNRVPRINSKAQLATYIENGRRKGQTTFYFVFPNPNITNHAEFDNFLNKFFSYVVPACYAQLDLVRYGTGRFICTIRQDYPGTHVANAYLNGNISKLTAEEQKLYNIAVAIVNEANKIPSEVEKARYIHNVICYSVKKYQNENDRNKTAIGALIDGYAQCQGYSDAFYMLGRMAGLNVRRIIGNFDGEAHSWNTITLSDGRTYCVDVTFDDGHNSYEYFLANLEAMKRHYTSDWSLITNLQ